ncbi:MAG: hypothetical protein AB1814_13185 [Thermodesulfobacteriota bacterium]
MAKEKFAAGCKGVLFHNGVVIVDFTGFSLSERDLDGNPKLEVNHRVVLTPNAMLETLDAMSRLAAKLMQAGVLKRSDQGASKKAAAQDDVDQSPPGKDSAGPKSPNF